MFYCTTSASANSVPLCCRMTTQRRQRPRQTTCANVRTVYRRLDWETKPYQGPSCRCFPFRETRGCAIIRARGQSTGGEPTLARRTLHRLLTASSSRRNGAIRRPRRTSLRSVPRSLSHSSNLSSCRGRSDVTAGVCTSFSTDFA